MTRLLIHRYDNELDILDVERRGYSDVYVRSTDDEFDLVAVVPTGSAKTQIAVVGRASSGQYRPDGGAPWPGRHDKYLVRINMRDVRYTTLARVRAAVKAARSDMGRPVAGERRFSGHASASDAWVRL